MGNSSTKEARETGDPRSTGSRQPASSATPDGAIAPGTVDRRQVSSSTRHRSSRHVPTTEAGDPALEPRKETRAERDARKAEKERAIRAKERERSLQEESIDGGYLVTLGVYVGPEDFSKPIVRQLMLERRLAPFWRGLNDHSDEWVEHQLVAAARGLPIPAPDEIPQDYQSFASPIDTTSQPIAFREASAKPSTTTSIFSKSTSMSPSSAPTTMFRGRSSTLGSLLSSSKNSSQQDLTPQEIQLPHDPMVNGQPVEAHLYKDASECPICFLYYPPYLNKTRCCNQPICSECFVQIKRPDPHPPEHADPSVPAPEIPNPETEGEWVSESATCPFCKQPEFGVSYISPPFKRGLAYASQNQRGGSFVKQASAMTSSASLAPPLESAANGNRRRATSLSSKDPQVITTDRIRPDWAKKLADARSHQARRAAAATALHNAAYLLGNGESSASRFGLGRRRRNNNLILTDGESGAGTPGTEGAPVNMEALLGILERQGAAREAAGRNRSRGDDLEEVMLMEAIRQSLASEEDRRKKEEKAAKKDQKEKAKELKKAEKAAKKSGSNNAPFYAASLSSPAPSQGPSTPPGDGKGKARAPDASAQLAQLSAAGLVPLTEPTSTLNTEIASEPRTDPQRYLEVSRANLDQSSPQTIPRAFPRHMSDASSLASSFNDSAPGSYTNGASFDVSPNNSGQYLPVGQGQDTSGSLGTEPMFNFQSLGAMMGKEELAQGQGSQHVEDLSSGSQSASHSRTQSKDAKSAHSTVHGGATAGGQQETKGN